MVLTSICIVLWAPESSYFRDIVDGKSVGFIGVFVAITGSLLLLVWVVAFFISLFILLKEAWSALNQLVVPEGAQGLQERVYTPNVRVEAHSEPE